MAKDVFAAVTRIEPVLGVASPMNLPAAEAFQQLLADTKSSLPTDPPGGLSPVDAVVACLKHQTILPTTDLLNEAIRQYIEGHANEKARELIKTMAATCTRLLLPYTALLTSAAHVDGVLPNGVTSELMAGLQLRTGNVDAAVTILMNVPTISPCMCLGCQGRVGLGLHSPLPCRWTVCD